MKLLIAFFILIYTFTGCQDKKLSPKYLTNISVVRETEESSRNTIASTPAPTSAEPSVTAASAPVPSTPQISKTNTPSQYHIIVASFPYAERNRAETLVQKLREKGYPAVVINMKKRYRVSIESFTNESEANAARDEYRKITDRQDIWILKMD